MDLDLSPLDQALLDDPVAASLLGPHAHLARRHGRAMTYRSDVSTFATVPRGSGADEWSDLATLLGPGELADLFSSPEVPPGWSPVFELPGIQMVASGRVGSATDPDVVQLTADDVPDVLELVAATRPGPFWTGTIEMGRYYGIRREGRLVAMAGRRLNPPGWGEISTVATAPEARGEGLAARLVRHAMSRIEAEGERAFLHVAAQNEGAIRLYEQLGFERRREIVFRGYTVPGDPR